MSELKRFIIDTSALLQRPEILARTGNRKIVIPSAVLHELSSRGSEESRKAVSKLLQEAIAKGVRVVKSPHIINEEPLVEESKTQRLSGVDIEIARIAIDYLNRYGSDGVAVVTLDAALKSNLAHRGIRSISPAAFLHESTKDENNPEILRSADSFTTKQRQYALTSVAVGLIASVVGNSAYSNLPYLLSTISVWGTLLALPAIGILLYWYRERFRLSYGAFEFIVGVMMSYRVFIPSFNYSQLTVVSGIQVLGGLYVMVRGLDNVSKGIEGTRFEAAWKKFFS